MIGCGMEASGGNSSASLDPPDGKKIFRQYCVTCHGVNGAMGANGAANLTHSVLSLEERIHVITNGRNTMTPFGSLLSDQKIAAVAAYTMQFNEETGSGESD